MNPLPEQRPHSTFPQSYKVCTGCGETKPSSAYTIARTNNDGLQRRCKECRRRYNHRHREQISAACKQHYKKNREHILACVHAYREANKERVMAYDRARSKANRTRRTAQARTWRAANREFSRLRNRLYDGQRRAATKGGRVTIEQWLAIVAAWKGRCAYCGKKPKILEQDHVIPLTRNGEHTTANLVPACHPCNASKGNRPLTKPVQLHLVT